jgi:hypothetical protein
MNARNANSNIDERFETKMAGNARPQMSFGIYFGVVAGCS